MPRLWKQSEGILQIWLNDLLTWKSRKYNVIEEHCTGDLAIVLKQQLQKVSKHMPTLDEVTSVKEKFFLVAQAGEQENEQLAQVVLRINSIYVRLHIYESLG